MHGLRVTVGEVYTCGSGTKRVGRRGHRGLPPLRLAGPLNATPAQRLASIEGVSAPPKSRRCFRFSKPSTWEAQAA